MYKMLKRKKGLRDEGPLTKLFNFVQLTVTHTRQSGKYTNGIIALWNVERIFRSGRRRIFKLILIVKVLFQDVGFRKQRFKAALQN